MKVERGRGARKGIAGIVAAVILFSMLFTVGTGYFLFVENQDLRYSQSLVARSNMIQDQQEESLQLTISTTSNLLGLTITNLGGVGVNVSALVVTGSTGNLLGSYTASNSGTLIPKLPIFLTPGQASAAISTGIAYTSGYNYTFRVLTQRGSVFTTAYPSTTIPLASQSLASGAIGLLYLKFLSYSYYNVYSGGGCPASGGGNSGYCLSPLGPAFDLSRSYFAANSVAFSVRITDLDPSQRNITLDQFSSMIQIWPGPANGNCAPSACIFNNQWYIVSNSTTTIRSFYTPIVLYYNKPVTLVFASYTSGGFSPNTYAKGNPPTSGQLVAVNMFWHGWLAMSYAGVTGPSPPLQNYGQNSPYVTTLYS